MNDETKDPGAPSAVNAVAPAETSASVAAPVVEPPVSAKPPEPLPVIFNTAGATPPTPPAGGTMAALRSGAVLVVMFGVGYLILSWFGFVGSMRQSTSTESSVAQMIAKSERERVAAEKESTLPRKPPPPAYAAPTITVSAGMIGDRRSFPDPPPPSASGSAKAVGKSSPAAEGATIESARTAIARGESAKALVILDGHDRDFAQGLMNPDATALRIEALARTGEDARAKQIAEGFLADFPHSPLASRVRALLDAINRKTAAAP